MAQNKLGPFAVDPQTVHFLNTSNVVKITDKLLGGNAEGKKPFRMAAKDGVGEIYIYDEIGGGFWDEGTTAKGFADDLKALGKIRTLNIFINSPGGSVFQGVAIFNILKRHSARKIVHIDGVAASVASVIAMAGDEINIAANGFMMIHEAWGITAGTAREHISRAGQLNKINDSILNTYAARTGTPENAIADMMAAETWMNAEEAVELGFADQITDEVKIAAHFDLGQFRNVPEDVAAKLDLAKNPPKLELVGEKDVKLQSVTFGKDNDTGKIYVLNEWPERTVISPELLAVKTAHEEQDWDHVIIECENGWADYVKDGETQSGEWTFRLDDSTYEHQPWPLEQMQPAEEIHEIKSASGELIYRSSKLIPAVSIADLDIDPDDSLRTPSLAITKMRQRMQKRGLAPKSDDEDQTAV